MSHCEEEAIRYDVEVQDLPKYTETNCGGLVIDVRRKASKSLESFDPGRCSVRRRLKDDGYVWVKNVLPREDVMAMREHYFSQFEGTGLLKPGTAYVDGIYNSEDDPALHRGVGGGNPQGEDELKRLTNAHVTKQCANFVINTALRKMVRDIMSWDEEVMLHRTLLRHCVPGGSSTGMNYEKLFLRGGSAFFLTAWVSIGDVSSIGGGLHYLSNSVGLSEALENDYDDQSRDFTPEEKINAFNRNMAATGYLADHPEEFMREHHRVAEQEGTAVKGYKWLIANFEAGDVGFHFPIILALFTAIVAMMTLRAKPLKDASGAHMSEA